MKKMTRETALNVRKNIFENYLSKNGYTVCHTHKGNKITANVYVTQGSKYNDTELHVAEKLTKAGFHVLFPNQGDFGKGRKNDVVLYDSKTYVPQKVELKSLFGNTAEAVKSQLISGSGQASIIAYDIQSGIRKGWLIEGLRGGWSKSLQKVMISWKGQWYEVDDKVLFDKKIYDLLK